MRKFTIAMLALSTIAATIVPANAQYRRNEPHRYNAPHYAPNRGSWVGPAIIGGLALGLGSALVYDRYRPHCWVEEQDIVDRYGRYLGTRDVRVCN